ELLAPAGQSLDDLPLLRGRCPGPLRAALAPAPCCRPGERARRIRGGRRGARQRARGGGGGGRAHRRVRAGDDPAPRRALDPSQRSAAPQLLSAPSNPSKGTHGPNADPCKARRLRPGAHRRDNRPLRAQGPEDHRAAPHDARPRAGREPLCRALRAPLLRRAGRLHHLGPARGDGARGPRCREGRAPGDRRDQPARGGPWLDPGRLRDRDGGQHGPRIGLGRVSRARGGAVLRGAVAAVPERPRLILASGSPQRRALLERLGAPFTVRISNVPETERGAPEQVTLANARRKARAVRAQGLGGSRDHVLACDTVVALHGEIYGKPADEDGARATLLALSGATHEVVSGLVLLLETGDRVPARRGERTAIARTEVSFRELDGDLLEWYLATGEWRGRAGGYAIQGAGAALVRAVAGDYENVVGLPLASL